MIVYPAIDLLNGNCVRLYKGEYESASRVASDPLETALSFVRAGATHLHMVDLNGAKDGFEYSENRQIVRTIIEKTGLVVDLGGGIRTESQIEEAIRAGVSKVVLGSAATDISFLSRMVSKFGPRICVGIDAKDGFVATQGWTDVTSLDYLEFAKAVEKAGVSEIIFTDISKDGTLEGPNLSMLRELKKHTNLSVTASGGVRSLEDLAHLDSIFVDGVICGKSIYAGTLDLETAVNRYEKRCV